MLEDIHKHEKNRKIVSIYDNWDIDFNIPLNEQLEKLHEGIIQVTFIRGYVMDLGWYPEHSDEGRFRGVLIKHDNWDAPIYDIETNNVAAITDWLTEMIELVLDFDLKH